MPLSLDLKLHGIDNFADVIKCRIWGIREYSWLS